MLEDTACTGDPGAGRLQIGRRLRQQGGWRGERSIKGFYEQEYQWALELVIL